MAGYKSLNSSQGGSLPTDNCRVGFIDYNDAATTTTPISVTGGAGFIELTNDGAGTFTNKTYRPVGVSEIWDTATNKFVFTDLKLGDMLDVRLDLNVTTTSPNQQVDVDLVLGIGAGEYSIPFISNSFKTTGVHVVNRYNGVYMGDTNTLDNPAVFKIKSDANCTVVVNGWYCKALIRG